MYDLQVPELLVQLAVDTVQRAVVSGLFAAYMYINNVYIDTTYAT